MKDIDALCTEFSLSKNFVYRCLRTVRTLQPYIHSGDKNKRFVDDEGLIIVQKISELKAQGLSLPDITKTIDKGLSITSDEHAQTPTQPTSNDTSNIQTDTVKYYTDQINDLHERLKNEQKQHLEEISDLRVKVESFQATLKMLPASPDAIQEFYRQAGRETLKREFEEQQAREREQARQRELQRIAEELDGLKWYEGKRRRELSARLRALLENNSLER